MLAAATAARATPRRRRVAAALAWPCPPLHACVHRLRRLRRRRRPRVPMVDRIRGVGVAWPSSAPNRSAHHRRRAAAARPRRRRRRRLRWPGPSPGRPCPVAVSVGWPRAGRRRRRDAVATCGGAAGARSVSPSRLRTRLGRVRALRRASSVPPACRPRRSSSARARRSLNSSRLGQRLDAHLQVLHLDAHARRFDDQVVHELVVELIDGPAC